MNALQCKACNASIPNGARFCGRCGRYIDMDQVDTKPLSIDQDAPTLLTDDLSTVQDDWNGINYPIQ